jgi:hypothetical protein
MPPLTNKAQTTRAILLAKATVTSILGLRSSMRAAQDPAGVARRQACRITALAPRISKRRMVRSPRFENGPELLLSARRFLQWRQPEPGGEIVSGSLPPAQVP